MVYRLGFLLTSVCLLTFSSCNSNKAAFDYNQDVTNAIANVNESELSLGKKIGPYTQNRPLDPKEFEEFLSKRTAEINGALDRAEKFQAPDSPSAKDFKAKLDVFIASKRSMVDDDYPKVLKVIQDNPQPNVNSIALIFQIFEQRKIADDKAFRPLVAAQEKMAKAHNFTIEPAK